MGSKNKKVKLNFTCDEETALHLLAVHYLFNNDDGVPHFALLANWASLCEEVISAGYWLARYVGVEAAADGSMDARFAIYHSALCRRLLADHILPGCVDVAIAYKQKGATEYVIIEEWPELEEDLA